MKRLFAGLMLVLSLLLASPRARAATIHACGEARSAPETLAGRITVICGLNLPEDFDVTPDGRHILVGDLGMQITSTGIAPSNKPAEISVIDTATDRVGKLVRIWDGGPNWGDGKCHARDPKGPFYVLGMNVSSRAPGVVQLVIVNNVQGDHIEFFQLIETGGRLTAAWRGCVDAPPDGGLDAVAPLPGGGVVASILCGKEFAVLDACIAAAKRGHTTGWLFAWTPREGARRLPNSEAALNNGLEVSRDGEEIYAVATGSKQLKVYSLRQERFVQSFDLPFAPDNAKMGPDGSVIVGGVTSAKLCLGKPGCTNGAWVMAVDPRAGRKKLLFQADDGLLAGTTGGLMVRGNLYVSSLTDPFILKIQPPSRSSGAPAFGAR